MIVILDGDGVVEMINCLSDYYICISDIGIKRSRKPQMIGKVRYYPLQSICAIDEKKDIYDAAVFIDKYGFNGTCGYMAERYIMDSFKGERRFRKLYPECSINVDISLRQAYDTGIQYVRPDAVNSIQPRGMVFDCNSLYAFLLTNHTYPVGRGRWVDPSERMVAGRKRVCYGYFMGRLKPGGVPCLRPRGVERLTEAYILDTEEECMDVSVTSADIEMICDNYDIDALTFTGAWEFESAPLPDPLLDTVEWLLEQKESAETHAERSAWKLVLTAIVGVLGRRPSYERSPMYTPIPIYCTAYARKMMVELIAANPNAIYCGVDSLHMIGREHPVGVKLDPREAGAFKIEREFDRAYYFGVNRYIHEVDGKPLLKISGIHAERQPESIEAVLQDGIMARRRDPRRGDGMFLWRP